MNWARNCLKKKAAHNNSDNGVRANEMGTYLLTVLVVAVDIDRLLNCLISLDLSCVHFTFVQQVLPSVHELREV